MIKRALVSVSDKTGLAEFAQGLVQAGVEIVSTGGTLKALLDAAIPAISVSDVTGFPECLDGRVKTLHPAIAGAILAVRGNPDHMKEIAEHGIVPIDLVVVNLYPFRKALLDPYSSFEDRIENIDIGGPTMLREAAKNFADVTVVCDVADYSRVLDAIAATGDTGLELRKALAAKVFAHTSTYDSLIARFLNSETGNAFPDEFALGFEKLSGLRYGENPHQAAAYYGDPLRPSGTLADATVLGGKELSFNNIADASAALEMLADFADRPSCVVVKHANPCAIASDDDPNVAWKKAYKADPVSIFGGIVAVNSTVDAKTAAEMAELFLEIILAPDYSDEALALLLAKKNLRVLKIPEIAMDTGGDSGKGQRPAGIQALGVKSVSGGILVQEPDSATFESLRTVTELVPDDSQMTELLFAYRCVKHVKSNAIAVVKDSVLIGTGPGQTNRVGALNIALAQAGEAARGAVMASDAFFPFDDCVRAAAAAGIAAIIQPGGSDRDRDSIAAANEAGIAMVFTGMRHFNH